MVINIFFFKVHRKNQTINGTEMEMETPTVKGESFESEFNRYWTHIVFALVCHSDGTAAGVDTCSDSSSYSSLQLVGIVEEGLIFRPQIK